MTVLPIALEPRSEAFRANAAAIPALVDDLREKSAAIALGGGQASHGGARIAANAPREAG